MRINNPAINVINDFTCYLENLLYSINNSIAEIEHLETRIENIQKRLKTRYVFRFQFLCFSSAFTL